ncbi:MAG: transporter [Fibrobacteres bacterium]|nr:transporter [Fibrobacterota bacterium]
MSRTATAHATDTPLRDTLGSTHFAILAAISVSHLLNDTVQSLIPAVYPVLKESFHLDFSQIGLIALVFNLTASLLQPAVGAFTDRRPLTYALPIGMGFTLIGLLLLSRMDAFGLVLLSVCCIGIGSSIFHPESSRVASMASGGRRGLAQSIFQLGGNAGSAGGPLLAALVVARHGRSSIAWFSLLPFLGILILIQVGKWKRNHDALRRARLAAKGATGTVAPARPGFKVWAPFAILMILIFSKYFYVAGLSSYFTFYLIDRFDVTVKTAQLFLAIFLVSSAAGTLLGGPLGDKIGRKYVIWGSILGVAPFSLILPHANLLWTGILLVPIGLILASAFSAILVYAHDLMPGKVGTVSGLFFGFAFGMGGLGSALLGILADHTGIGFVFKVTAFLPLIGLAAAFLPNLKKVETV